MAEASRRRPGVTCACRDRASWVMETASVGNELRIRSRRERWRWRRAGVLRVIAGSQGMVCSLSRSSPSGVVEKAEATTVETEAACGRRRQRSRRRVARRAAFPVETARAAIEARRSVSAREAERSADAEVRKAIGSRCPQGSRCDRLSKDRCCFSMPLCSPSTSRRAFRAGGSRGRAGAADLCSALLASAQRKADAGAAGGTGLESRTTGVTVLARARKAQSALLEEFRERRVRRSDRALSRVAGGRRGRDRQPRIDGETANTRWRVARSGSGMRR